MAAVKKTKDIAAHQAKVAAKADQKKRRVQADAVLTSVTGKKFSQLSAPAKDKLLEALALRFGYVEPED
jgi:hypothetical protein